MNQPVLGILGGTFDPVHLGHTQIARFCYDTYGLESILFIPCQAPNYKEKQTAHASTADRCQMLKLALAELPFAEINLCEIERSSPSYTVLTLQTLKKQYPNHHLCFILGADALATMTTWYEWQLLPTLAHFIVIPRHTVSNTGVPLTPWPSEENAPITRLGEKAAGLIYHPTEIRIDISSTAIRHRLQTHDTAAIKMLNDDVYQYIVDKQLYLPRANV